MLTCGPTVLPWEDPAPADNAPGAAAELDHVDDSTVLSELSSADDLELLVDGVDWAEVLSDDFFMGDAQSLEDILELAPYDDADVDYIEH